MNEPLYPDYDYTSRLLGAEHSHQQLAEVHGMLVGLLVAGGYDQQTWLSEIVGTETTEHDSVLSEELVTLLSDLQLVTVTQLGDPELAFQLYLPDDACSLRERTEALAQWCQGFTYGVGLSDLPAGWTTQSTTQEFLEDVGAIANAVSTQSGEQEEAAFVELIEYVRVGVMLLRTDLEACRRKVAMH
jgi:uncharacterized protein YgfB (UPF0149 family)